MARERHTAARRPHIRQHGSVLIAEELVLLALHPDGTLARGQSTQPSVATGVTGALVAELALAGHIDLGDGRIRLTGSRPDHPVLAQALDNLSPHAGKKLKSRLGAVKRAGWSEVVDGMIADGALGRDKASLRPTRHPITDPGRHAQLLARLQQAATADVDLDDRTAVLLALSGPCQLLEVVAPERSDRAEAKRRIAEAADRVPAAGAVKHVIDSVNAAVIATTAAAATASS